MQSEHSRRKEDHLRICSQEDVDAAGVSTGLERYRLAHCAVPELALAEIDLTTSFMGKLLRAPVLISALTGGTAAAKRINYHLAQAAESAGVAMCVGSQRAAIEDSALENTYQVRAVAPSVLLFANLGAVQLNYGYGLEECQRAVDMIGADALVLHLNPLQEALQSAGNVDFRGVMPKIAALCRALPVPVVVKEVGWGISANVASQLVEAGVAAIDVAGAGGTSWSQVERHRSQDRVQARIAAAFAGWGIPTAEAIRQVRRALPCVPLIASGGIASGPAAAIALALGADLVGTGRPLLIPAMAGDDAVAEELAVLIGGLRTAMFASGLPNIQALKRATLYSTVEGAP